MAAIGNDFELDVTLAALGVSSLVLVVEAILRLEDAINPHFVSAGVTNEDVREVLAVVPSEHEPRSFSRFASGIYYASLPEQDETVYSAACRCVHVFWDSLQQAAKCNPDNSALRWMAFSNEAEVVVVKGWKQAFALLQERRQSNSQPFSFLGGDLELAERAVAALIYIGERKVDKFKDFCLLVKASIAFLKEDIKYRRARVQRYAVKQELEERTFTLRLPRRAKKEDGLVRS